MLPLKNSKALTPFFESASTRPKVNHTSEVKMHSGNLQFQQIGKQLLEQYIQGKRESGNFIVDLRLVDLSGIELCDVDFTNTIINRQNFIDILHGNGCPLGTTVAENEDIANWDLEEMPLNKVAADWLIDAGADVKSVLTSYLATTPSTLSHQYKADLLTQYLDMERGQGKIPVDLSAFDLSNVNLKDINFTDAYLSPDNLNAIIVGGGKLDGVVLVLPRVLTPAEERKVQANFEHDFLKMLTVYSQTVASIVLKSSTLDFVHNVSRETMFVHDDMVNHLRQINPVNPDSMKSIIKSSTGNCSERAIVCKSMFDLYLKESLKQLGYQYVTVKSTVISAVSPSDHTVVETEYFFHGVSKKYIVDAWSEEGKAWTSKDGMDYFVARPPDRYTQPDIKFIVDHKINSILDAKQYQSSTRHTFERFGVKAQLDSAIKAAKPEFRGSPIA